MFAKQLTNPLRAKIEQIVITQSRDKKIRHSAFNEFRNRESVRSVLSEMGFKPDCESKPILWAIKSPSDIEGKPITRHHHNKKIHNPKYKAVLAALETKEVVYVDGLDMSYDYARKIVLGLKELGWQINALTKKPKGSGRAQTIGWKLISR